MMKNNILFVCPLEGWGARERTVLKDILILKNRGDNVYLFALKDSYIDLKAAEFSIPVIHFFGKLSTKVLKWRKLKLISKNISKLNINIIHCYDVGIIWPIAFFLRNDPLVTCILSVFSNIDTQYRKLIHRTLSKRIDFILNYNEVHQNNIIENMGVPGFKIGTENFPINTNYSSDLSRSRFLEKMGIETEDEISLIGTYVDVNTKSIDNLAPLLDAVNVFIRRSGKECRLILFNEKNWGNSLIYPEIIKYMKEIGIEENVVFYRANSKVFPAIQEATPSASLLSIEEIQPILDLWVNIDEVDCLDDFMLSSLLSGSPVLGVRVSSLKEFYSKYQGVGDSYRIKDSREIRAKIEELLTNQNDYKQNIKKYISKLEVEVNFELYTKRLIDLYSNAKRKRMRFFKKKNNFKGL